MNPENALEQAMVETCLSGRIRKLGRAVNGIYDRKYRPFGVRSSQVNLLVVISATGPTPSAEICRRLCLEKSTLSRDLDRLIEQGWITAAEAGGRRQQLEITAAGRALIRDIEPAWNEAQAEVKALLGTQFTSALLRAVDESFVVEEKS